MKKQHSIQICDHFGAEPACRANSPLVGFTPEPVPSATQWCRGGCKFLAAMFMAAVAIANCGQAEVLFQDKFDKFDPTVGATWQATTWGPTERGGAATGLPPYFAGGVSNNGATSLATGWIEETGTYYNGYETIDSFPITGQTSITLDFRCNPAGFDGSMEVVLKGASGH